MIRSVPYPSLFLAIVLVGCGGNSSDTPAPITPDRSLRISDSQTGVADGDSLAAALLLSTDRPAHHTDRSRIQMTNAALRDRLTALALTHLQVNSAGATPGPGLASSATLVREAGEPGAPTDSNGNGSNVDETLAAKLASFAAMTGGQLDPSIDVRLFAWRHGSADYAAPGSDTDLSRPTLTIAEGEVSLAQMARAMLARTLLGTGLLQRNRGSRPGETAEEGLLGLLLLQQALAIEETLFSNLFMNGLVPGLLQFPSDYDPADGARWLPSVVDVNSPRADGVGANSYRVIDSASTLETVAAMLRAGGELSFYASDKNPNPNLRDIFRGHPFGPRSSGGTDDNSGASVASGRDLVTWESGVGEVLGLWCSGCHITGFGHGGFASDGYDAVHLGGNNSRPGSKTPIIVRGDPANSVLYYILLANPPKPFFRMPAGGGFPAKALKLVEDWIKDGARSSPPKPPRIGLDLAVVSYQNLVALHLDPSGALYARNDVDAPPIPNVDVAATGEVLQALAGMVHLEAELVDYRVTFEKIALFAIGSIVNDAGVVFKPYIGGLNVVDESAGLFEQARMVTGLLAAARVLQSAEIENRGTAAGRRLLADFFDSTTGLFRSRAGESGLRYSSLEVAAVVDALREMAQAGMDGAIETHELFLSRLGSVLVYSETEATGEVLADGIPDTDQDGILEPAHAGGKFGRAPVFAGEIKQGPELPPVDGPILWSTHILPLFQGACAQCHMGGANRGEYRMDTPTRLRVAGKDNPGLPLVVPRDPEASYLYRKLVDRTATSGDQMPLLQPPLSSHGKELVRRWILEGASSR